MRRCPHDGGRVRGRSTWTRCGRLSEAAGMIPSASNSRGKWVPHLEEIWWDLVGKTAAQRIALTRTTTQTAVDYVGFGRKWAFLVVRSLSGP